MTVRPVAGLKVRASRFFMPQSSWCEPLRKKPGARCGWSAWNRCPSLSASGMSSPCVSGLESMVSAQRGSDVAAVYRGDVARGLQFQRLVQERLRHVVGRHLAAEQVAGHVVLLAQAPRLG